MKKLFGSKGKHAKSTNKIMSRSIALLLAFIMLFGVVFTALSNEITALADGIVLVALSDDVMILTDDRGEYDYTDTDSDVIDSDYDVATDDVATDDDGYLSETDDDYLSIYMDEEAIADVVAYDGYIGIMPLNVNLWYINTDVPRLPASPGGLNIYRITNLTELSFRHRTRFDGYDNHRMMFYYGIGPAGTPFHENAFIVGITEGVNINTGFSYGTLSEGIYFADISERTAWNEGTVLPPLPGHWGQSMLNVWALPQSAFIEINVQRTSSFVDIRGVDATGERYQINNHDNSTAPGQGQAGFPLGTFPLGTEEPLFNNNRLTYLDQPPVINPRSITVGRPVQDRHGEISEDEDETWWEIRLADGTVAASGTMADLGPHGQIPDSAIATLDTNVVYTVVMRVQESVPAGFPDPENIWSESRGRFMFTPLLDIEKKVRCITDGTGHLDGHDYIESRVGDHIVYTIRVTNRSPLGVNDLLMIDDLAGLVGNYITGIRDITLNGVPVSPQSSALVGTELRVGIPHLAGGAYADISFTATVLPGAAGESWVNEARLRDANNDQLWFYSVEREPVYDQHPAGLNPDGTVRYETVRRYQYTENRDRPLICEAEVEAPPAPNLEILKLVNGYPSIVSDVNETLTYTIRVRNTGYAAKTNFYMVDDLNHLLNPPTPLADARITDIRNIRVDDVAAPGTFAGGVLTVHIESLAPGDYVLISFQATVLPEASGHSFRNTARLVDENGEQMYEYEWSYEYLQEWCDTEDDYVYVEDANGNRIPVYSHGPSDRPLKSPAKVVVPPPGLRIEKKVSNYGDSELHDNITADVGELITYTITVSNRGEGTKLNFQMVDDLGNTTPNGRNLIDVYIENVHNIRVNGAALAAPSTFVNGVLTVVIPSLAPDAQVVIEFDAYVLPAAAGQTWTNLSVLQDRHGNQLYYEYEYEYWCEEEEEYVTVTQERPHQDESTVVVPKPLVRINKSVDRPYPQFVDVGEYLTYTIEVRNLPRDNEPTATALDFWMIDDLAHLVDTYIDNVR
ncbi:MAG: isopeptide-forming domain-containing fimbrial protein, partial [Oscillospiraceae bacterium]|nr:isopeptide-forming domain-containing fimbrial protein [Oscillospiraceae bacterium]